MDNDKYSKIEVTWYHAIRLWWSITWQALLYGGLFSFIFLLIIMQVSMILKLSIPFKFITIFRIVSIFIAQIIVLKMVLTQKFKKFHIILISNQDSEI